MRGVSVTAVLRSRAYADSPHAPRSPTPGSCDCFRPLVWLPRNGQREGGSVFVAVCCRSLALPRCALLRVARPCRASPRARRGSRTPATTIRATSLASPHLAWPCLVLPGPALPCRAAPGTALPCSAWAPETRTRVCATRPPSLPGLAGLCRDEPCQAELCPAEPRPAVPVSATRGRRGLAPRWLLVALHSPPAGPGSAMPGPARPSPATPSVGAQGLNLVCMPSALLDPLPGWAVPRLAPPRLAQPCRTAPHRAAPGNAASIRRRR